MRRKDLGDFVHNFHTETIVYIDTVSHPTTIFPISEEEIFHKEVMHYA